VQGKRMNLRHLHRQANLRRNTLCVFWRCRPYHLLLFISRRCGLAQKPTEYQIKTHYFIAKFVDSARSGLTQTNQPDHYRRSGRESSANNWKKTIHNKTGR